MAKSKTKNSPGSLYFFAAFIILISAIMLYSAHNEDKQRTALKQTCTADVTAVVTRVDEQKKTRSTRKNGRTRRVTYYVYTSTMVYEYKGKEYTATDSWEDSSPYSEGMEVAMKCNPDDPSTYYIARGSDGNAFKTMLIPVVLFVGVAILLICIAHSEQKKRKATNYGMTYDQWAAAQQQHQPTPDMASIGMEGIGTDIGINDSDYLSSLNDTQDYMDSI